MHRYYINTSPDISRELLEGTVEGKRRWGRPSEMWVDNIKDWTQLSVDDLLDST